MRYAVALIAIIALPHFAVAADQTQTVHGDCNSVIGNVSGAANVIVDCRHLQKVVPKPESGTDERAWQAIQAFPTRSRYVDYVDRFPHGRYVEAALEKMKYVDFDGYVLDSHGTRICRDREPMELLYKRIATSDCKMADGEWR